MRNNQQTMSEQLLEEYIKSTLNLIGDCSLKTGMTVDEEEKCREDFYELFLTLSHTEMVHIAQRVLALAHEYLPDHPERGYLTLRLLEEILGSRYATSFLKKHATTVSMSDPRQEITYTSEDEAMMTGLIRSLKKDIPESHRGRAEKLIEHITGTYDE